MMMSSPTAIFVPTGTTDTENALHCRHSINAQKRKILKKPNRRLRGNNKNTRRKDRHKFNKIKNTLDNNIVINLSTYKLNNSEVCVLNKGLGFALTHLKPNYTNIDKDLKRFERTLQLHYHFTTQDSSDNTYHRKALENNKDWWPKKLHPNITEFCNKLGSILHDSYKYRTSYNLTKSEVLALKSLRNNKRLIIIRADKGGAICVLDKDDYMSKINEMLSDVKVYSRIHLDDTAETKRLCDESINKLYHSRTLTYKQHRFLTNFIPKCPRFYGLPKIHKEGCPLRPIVSQINGPTRGINQLLDTYLTVAEKNIPYILQDTTAFLNVLSQLHVDENTYLFTLDVVSLYTNIPHEEGARWVSDYYEETLHLWNSEAPDIIPVDKNTIFEMILLILTNTTFTFDKYLYCQNYGTTMGAIFSVKFANIYMHKWLQHFVPLYTGLKPPFLARLVDDCFGVYNSSKKEFLQFFNYLNNCHPTIKFEYTFSQKEVTFLDTVTYIEDNFIKTKLYTKPTDRKQYLHYRSDHPHHTKKSIPYSQAIRYRRIISDDMEFERQLSALKRLFTNRSYPSVLVENQLVRASNLQRLELLTTRQKSAGFINGESAFLPLIVPHNKSLIKSNFQLKLKNIWTDFLYSDISINKVFDNTTPKIVFKRGVTIQQVLNCKNNMTTTTELDRELINNLACLLAENADLPHSKPCGSSRCLCCKHMNNTSFYRDSNSSKTFSITENFNCSSSEIIYMIECNLCHKIYIGQTKRSLRDRLNNHISDIKLRKQTAVAIHFNQPLHSFVNLTLTIIKSTCYLNITDTETLEYSLMKTLNTIYPNGLNFYPINRD